MDSDIRLLHVDDDPGLLDVTAAYVEQQAERFEIHTATSADEALELLSTRPVDCVVADYEMPGMNGLELLDAVRETHPNLPFVLFTGKGSEEVASEAISAGVSDYLEKGAGTEQYELLANRVRNLVEGRRAERERERQLEAIESAQEGMSILDAEGHFIYVNEAYADLYGYEPADLIGEHWELLYREEDVSEIETEILPTVEETGSWQGETVGLRADGSTFLEAHRLAKTADGGLVCSVRNATPERNRAQELQRYKAFVEHSPTLVTLLDENGEVIYDNTGLELEWRHGPEDFFGENVLEYIHPEDVDRVANALERVYEEPDEPVTVEFRFEGADAEFHWLRSIAINMLDDPMVEGVPVSTIDISERKRREAELERQNARLEEFAGVVSHDLRNPLNVAMGNLDLASEDCETDYHDRVATALDRIDELIEDLLTLARMGKQVEEPEMVALADIVEECWQNVPTAAASLDVESDLEILADRARLRQLLENLIRNAIEHGTETGTVRLGSLPDGEGFFVADDGPGIPADEREVIFESGYSSRDDGTGFGLAIVREIVEAHEWSVDITKSADGGARFEISGLAVAG